ncbi:MAG: spermidine/putrescine transport system permease protein [Thermoleophilaceae bacterium]|nr:spermidine/putrescine transport system permease protein [Thermoleophilaceae bacterium]
MRRGLWHAFLVPPGLWLLALYLVPIGFIAAVSVATVDFIGNPVYGWNTGNYHEVLSSTFLPPLERSLLYALATTIICLAVGYPTAYVVARYGGRLRHVLIALLILPWFVDYLVRIYAWVAIFGDKGLVNGVLGDLGMGGEPPVTFLNTTWAVIGGLVYSYFPFMILPIYAAVERMDSALVEAGKDLYATPLRTFLHVTLPETFQGVLGGCVLVFLPAAGDFANAQLLGGPNQTMIGNLIQDQFSGSGDWPLGSAMTVVFMAILALFMIFYLRSSARAASTGGAGL